MRHPVKSYSHNSFFVSIIILLTILVSAHAKPLPKNAKLVPPETIVLLDIDNFSQAKIQFEKTNIYKLYKDPVMAAFVESAKVKIKEKIRKMDSDIAYAVFDSEMLPQGRLAVALVLANNADPEKPAFLLISQWGQALLQLKEVIDKAVKKSIEKGSHPKNEDYRGTSITTIIEELPPLIVPDVNNFRPDQNDELNSSQPTKSIPQPPSKISYCFLDDSLFVSDDIELIKFALAHIDSASSPSLADEPDFIASMAETGPFHDVDCFINLKHFIKSTTGSDPSGMAQTYSNNLGLSNLSSLAISLGFAKTPVNSWTGKIFIKVNGAKKGILKILEAESAALKAPRFIPSSASSLMVFNLNIPKAYDEIYTIMNGFSPAYAAMFTAPLIPPGQQGEPALQLKGDIIDHLGSQILTAQLLNKPFSADASPSDTLIAVAVSNRSALEKSLSLLHSKVTASDNTNNKRQLLGHTLYLLNPSQLPPFLHPGLSQMKTLADAKEPKFPNTAFTITDTHLIFGSEQIVERAIRTLDGASSASLDSAAWFSSAKSSLPSLVGFASLEDNVAATELFWWMLKESGKKSPLHSSLGQNAGLLLPYVGDDIFNFTLLPSFDSIKKYWGLSVFYGVSKPQGFFLEFKDISQPISN